MLRRTVGGVHSKIKEVMLSMGTVFKLRALGGMFVIYSMCSIFWA